MAFISVSGTAMAELLYTQQGQQTENTLYFRHIDPWDLDALEELGAALEDWWVENIQPNMSNTVSLDRIRLTNLSSDISPVLEYVGSLPAVGAATTAPLPNNVTAAITFYTGNRGRSFRGRNYLVGLLEPQVDGNYMTEANVTFWQDTYMQLLTVADSIGAEWVIVSRYHLGLPRTVGITTPVIGVRMNGTIDSQRRRLPERGR